MIIGKRKAIAGVLSAVVAACILSLACQLGADVAQESAEPDAVESPRFIPARISATEPSTELDPLTLSNDDRGGTVIDGICPAELPPVPVTSDEDTDEWDNDWKLTATPYVDKVVLLWVVPDIDGLTGYVGTRFAYDSDWNIDLDTLSAIAIDDASAISSETARFADSDGIESGERYSYRVFPIVADGLGAPSLPVTVWTPPDSPPPAPVSVRTSYGADGVMDIGIRYGIHAWEKGIRVARRSASDPEWRIVHESTPEPGRDWDLEHYKYYGDTSIERGAVYRYAVCFANSHGFGPALEAGAVARIGSSTVGPPENLGAVVSRDGVTFYWDPIDDESVTGYESDSAAIRSVYFGIERHYSRFSNHVNQVFDHSPSSPRYRFRVRAITDDGPGPWSDYLEVESTLSEVDVSPNGVAIIHLTADHDEVHGVWGTDRHGEDVKYRLLRREVGRQTEFLASDSGWEWEALDDYDWDAQFRRLLLGWSDSYGLHPDTEYEYAVQLRIGAEVLPPSEPVSIWTKPLPVGLGRAPVPVQNLNAKLTDVGLELSWELPDDPTLTALQIRAVCQDPGSNRDCYLPYPLVSPDATTYLALREFYSPYHDNWIRFDVRTINARGYQANFGPWTYVRGDELLHCNESQETVERGNDGNYGHFVQIELRGCESTEVEVVRRELTADGFVAAGFVQPCDWSLRDFYGYPTNRPVTYVCTYADYDVKPSTWYVYEIRQTQADGTVESAVRQILTRKQDLPPPDQPDQCAPPDEGVLLRPLIPGLPGCDSP